MINSRMSAKSLRTMLRTARRQLTNRQNVAAKHAPGTAYHTRATKEAAALESRIREILKAIEGKS